MPRPSMAALNGERPRSPRARSGGCCGSSLAHECRPHFPGRQLPGPVRARAVDDELASPGKPRPAEQVHPVRHELVHGPPELVSGLGFLAELPGAERIGLHHLAREVGQAVLEEAVGVDDDHPRPEVELLDDCQREPVGFTEAEAEDVIAQPPRLEEGVEHAWPRAEHQPRVAEQDHVGALEMIQGDRHRCRSRARDGRRGRRDRAPGSNRRRAVPPW